MEEINVETLVLGYSLYILCIYHHLYKSGDDQLVFEGNVCPLVAITSHYE